ncbi:MAG: cytochrome c oxidase subunit 3 [Alphaproteobacteria bacterium]
MADTSPTKHHDYLLVDPSPWPLAGGVAAFLMAFGAIVWMKSPEAVLGFSGPWMFGIGTSAMIATMFFWLRDVLDEAVHKRLHTPVVQTQIRYGMILFIASEVMFFVAWFWAYYFTALFPGDVHEVGKTLVGVVGREQATGGLWPPAPTGDGRFISTFNPWSLPLINTLILLTSGVAVTYAHYALQKGNRRGLIVGLVLTIVLGLMFTSLQAYEYYHAQFTFAGHIYGSTFFMATGFHGFHVIIGTIFLGVMLLRAVAGQFTPKHHVGFVMAAWYWHFVDIVWLFLFISIYVWGAGAVAAH